MKYSKRPARAHHAKLNSVKPIAPVMLSASILMSALAFAGPEGGVVKGGAGAISRAGNTTTIEQATERMAIDWSSYNVAADERVQYIQPNSSSVSLNRIMSNTGSEIHGRIDANGQVILMNPHGILFGENSVVNAGGILATGLSIDADDFMNGDFTFRAMEGTDGVVINSGILNAATGGSVALLGKQVKNEGLISAKLGTATFAAGQEAYVTFDAEGLVGVRITQELLEQDIGVDAAVINEGTIQAEDGQVLLSASVSQDIFTQAMNTGDIDYGGSVVVHEDGSFTLGAGADVINSGAIDVSGEKGGSAVVLGQNITHSGEILADSLSGDSKARVELHSADTTLITEQGLIQANAGGGVAGDIKVLGENVGLVDKASVRASGEKGGGRILVGGDVRGANAFVPNARAVYFGQGAELSANALQQGVGGDIVLYGTEALSAYGSINALGLQHAKGGFVETSSKWVDLDLDVDISGATAGGQWLIDPWDITIGSSDNNSDLDNDDDPADTALFTPLGASSSINVNSLKAALVGTKKHVTVETGGDSGAGTGKITLESALNFNGVGNSTLKLDAHGDIEIKADISDEIGVSQDTLNLDLIAGGDIIIDGGSAVVIDTNGGYFNASFQDTSAEGVTPPGGDFFLGSGDSIITGGGAFTIDPLTRPGDISIRGEITTNGGTFTVGSSSNRVASFVSAWDSSWNACEDENCNSMATIDTSSDTSNFGNVNIYTTGLISLGNLYVGSDWNGSANPAPTLNVTLDNDDGTTGDIYHQGLMHVGTNVNTYTTVYTVTADDDIYLGRDAEYDNTEGSDNRNNISNVTLTAGQDVFLLGDSGGADANIYTGGGSIAVTGRNLQIGNDSGLRGQLNAESGAINITMTGDINVFDNVESWSGETVSPIRSKYGDITVTGATFTANQTSSISTEDSSNSYQASTVRITTTNGDATLGRIDLRSDNSDSINTDLIVRANGDILQGSGELLVSGITVLSTDYDGDGSVGNSDLGKDGDITLNNSSNNFAQGLHILAANNATISDANSIEFIRYTTTSPNATFSASDIEGDLTVTANGAITDALNASLTVGGTATFAATGNNITLDNTSNDFGEIELTANDAEIVDANGIALGVTDVDNLVVSAGGSITESGGDVIDVANDISLQAQDGSEFFDITLGGNDHQLSYFRIIGAKDVAIKDSAGNLQVGNGKGVSSITGNLTVTAVGSVSDEDNNTFTVGGHLSITSPGQSVDLDQTDNSYGSVSVYTQGVSGNQGGGQIDIDADSLTVVDLNTLGFGSGLAANINITVDGDFTQNGAIQGDDVTVDGDSSENSFTFNAGSSENTVSFEVDAGGQDDRFYILADTSAELNGEGGEDLFEISVSTSADLNGGDDDDTFSILYDSTAIAVSNIDGGADDDRIEGPGVAAWWTTSDDSDGDIYYTAALTGDSVSFDSIEELVGGSGVDTMDISDGFDIVSGGAGNDIIELQTTADIDTGVYGGSGNDTIKLLGSGASLEGVYGGDLEGNDSSTNDVLEGYAVADAADRVVWSIDGSHSIGIDEDSDGSIDSGQQSFSQFEILQGNDSVDVFNLADSSFSGQLRGGDGADVFNMNAANLSVVIHGNDGSTADSDLDTLRGYNGESTWNFGVQDGNTVLDARQLINGGTSTFNDIQVAQGNSDEDTFNVRQLFDGQILGGADNDVFNFYASPEVTTPSTAKIQGGAGNDRFIIHDAGVIVAINGNEDNDTFQAADDANVWTIDTGVRRLVSAGSTSTFANVEILQGGSAVDTFEVQEAFTGQLLGGDGNDIFNLYADVDDLGVNAEVEDIRGEGDADHFYILSSQVTGSIHGGATDSEPATDPDTNNDTIYGFTVATDWTVTGDNTGSIDISNDDDTDVTFAEIENLVGGDGFVDSFVFESGGDISGQIDGGSGANIEDEIDYSGASSAQTIALGAALNGIVNVEKLLANDVYVNTLSVDGFNSSVWEITGEYTGTVSATNNTETLSIGFTNFHVLTGSVGTDTFAFVPDSALGAPIPTIRRIQGGAGDDWVSYEGMTTPVGVVVDNTSIAWLSSTETDANGDSVADNNLLSSVEWLIGGSGTNSLTYSSADVADDGANAVWTVSDFGEVDAGDNPFGTGAISVDGDYDGEVILGSNSVSFVNFQHLTGGQGNDRFVVEDTGSITSLSGGANANNDSDTIVGRADDTIWTISGPNSGSVDWGEDGVDLTFTSIENLEGQDNFVDTFTFTQPGVEAGSISGLITAGGGFDNLGDRIIDVADYSDVDEAQELTIGSTTAGIERLIANPSQVNSLTGSSTYYRWEVTDIDGTGSIDGSNDGYLYNADKSDWLEFVNFNTLIGADAVDDEFTITATGSIATIQGGSGGNDQLIGRSETSGWTVNGANSGNVAGIDSASVYVSNFSGIETLTGSNTAADSFVISTTGSFTGTINAGSGAGDSLVVATPTAAAHANHRENYWLFATGLTQVSRVNTSDEVSQTTTFSGMESVSGGAGRDVFAFNSLANHSSLNINTPDTGGSDVLDISAISNTAQLELRWTGSAVNLVNVNGAESTLASVAGADSVVGNGSDNVTLVSPTTNTNTWTISAENLGNLANDTSLLGFSAINNLEGNTLADAFTINADASFDGNINGVGTGNSLTWTAVNQTWELDDATAFSGDVASTQFDNIQALTGDNATSTLVGRNQTNHWMINNINDGYVQLDGDSSDRINFYDMAGLHGNAAADRFQFTGVGRVTDTVRGAEIGSADSADDQIQYASSSTEFITWNLGTSSVNSGNIVDGTVQNEFVGIDIFTGGDGRDIFEIENSSVSARVYGEGGSTDLVRLNYDSSTDWSVAGDTNDRVVASGAGTVYFSGIEQAEGSNNGGDIFTVSASVLSSILGRGGNDRLELDTTTVSDYNLQFTGGGGADEIRAGNRENAWVISGSGDNANTLNYVSAVARGVVFDSTLETLTGGTLNDSFTVATDSDLNITVNGDAVAGSNTGADTLTGANRGNSWVIGGNQNSQNTLNYQNNSSRGVAFSGIENYLGGTGLDAFSYESGSVGGEISGGGGTSDSLVVNRSGVSSTSWEINTANGGTVDGITNGFRAIENLSGGDSTDNFVITATGSLTGLLQGGSASSDTLDISAFVNGVAVEIGETVTPAVPNGAPFNIHVNHIETITAADSTVANENNNWLVNNLSGNYSWAVNAPNDGRITGSGINPVNFINFGTLVGGAGDDTFAFSGTGAVSGNFDGGAQSNRDTADFSALTDEVEIALNDIAAAIQFSNIEHLVGNNSGLDSGNSNVAKLVVAAGTTGWALNGINSGAVNTVDTDVTFEGFNHLIGGSGTDTFTFNSGSWVSGRVDGGVDTLTDIVDAQTIGNPFNAQLNGETYGNLNIFNIDHIQANGGGNQLHAAPTGSHQWDVSADNGVGTINTSLQFEGFNTLVGNGSVDVFTVSAGVRIIELQGGDGMDTLTVLSSAETSENSSNYTNWYISGTNSGSVSSRVNTFSDIENLTGGAGQDAFVFSDAGASLSGLIDGGEAAQDTDVNIDTLDVSVFNDGVENAVANGVVVEIGDEVEAGTIVDGTDGLANVNAHNIERVTAADLSGEFESNNWLALNHDDDVVLRLTEGTVNDGYIQKGTEGALVVNTRIDFFNFGGLQGGGGNMDDNIVDGNPTGEYREGTGRRSRNFSSVPGLVVVDISPNLVSVTGNGNTLLRVVPAEQNNTDGNFNGDNIWNINAENAGTFNASYKANEDGSTYVLDFSGVNMLQGGDGSDTFNFVLGTNDDGDITTGSLLNGSINGGIGSNVVNVSSATSDLTFGFGHLRSTAETLDYQTDASYPSPIVYPVFLVESIGREGITDLVNIDELVVTANNETTLVSDNVGDFSWTISSEPQQRLQETNSARELFFSGVDVIRGGEGSDTFTIQQLGIVRSHIDGGRGSGTDVLDVSSLTGALQFSLQASPAVASDLSLDNIETLNSSADAHRILAADEINNWTIDGINSGTIAFTNASGEQSLRFSSMLHLQGGANTDTFLIANGGALTGTVDGGGQNLDPDRLYLAADATQELTLQVSELAAATAQVTDFSTEHVDVVGLERIDAISNGQSHTLYALSNATNTWTIGSSSTLAFAGNSISFSGFDSLVGGAGQDQFIFDGLTVDGLIDGGANSAAAVDTASFSGIDDRTVHIGNRETSDINLLNIESVQASGSGMTLRGDDLVNDWAIDDPSASNTPHQLTQTLEDGSSQSINFGGFANLYGGNKADEFIIKADEAIPVFSQFGGGDAVDTLNLLALTQVVTVSRDPAATATFYIDSIENVTAADNGNTLIGGSTATNTWIIDNLDSGSVNESGAITAFSGFSHLRGGAQVDVFEFEQVGTDVGSISGSVSGGDQPTGERDRVDMSGLDKADVIIGDTTSGYSGIEEYRGKGSSSSITAADRRNTWTITDVDTGTIVDDLGTNIRFIDFGILNGGSRVDTFIVDEGRVTGNIQAGGSLDELRVGLGEGRAGGLNYDGGADGSTIEITGGSDAIRFDSSFIANADGSAVLEHMRSTDGAPTNYRISYSNASAVEDKVFSDVMVINPVAGQADTVTINDNSFTVDGYARVDIDNKNSIDLVGETEDSLILQGRIIVTDYFAVENASMSTQGDNAGITASGQIIFNNTSGVGSADTRLEISTASLVLNNPRSDVYLSQTGSLDIAEMNAGSANVDIISTGSISDSGDLDSLGNLTLSSNNAIVLDNNNTLSGLVSLQASDQIELRNGATRLGDIRTQNFTLNPRANVIAEGSIVVSNTTRINGADSSVVQFDGDDHEFNRIIVDNAGSLVLQDSSSNGVSVEGRVRDALTISADGAITANAIIASDLTLQAANDNVSIQSALVTKNSVTISGNNVDINGGITVTESTAEQAVKVDTDGVVNIRSSVTADGLLPGDIEIRGSSVVQHAGAPISGAEVVLVSGSDLELQSNLAATQQLELSAAGTVNMADNIRAEASSFNIDAGDTVSLEQIVGAIIDVTSRDGNIIQNADIDGEAVTMTASNGSFTSRAGVNLDFDDTLVIKAQLAELNGIINSENGIANFDISNNMRLNGTVEAQSIVALVGGQLAMNSDSSSLMRTSTNMNITTGEGLQITLLDGQQGEVNLTVGGAASDHNGDNVNIIANNLIAQTTTGFGTFEKEGHIETSVSIIDVRNNLNGIGVENVNGDLTVNALITNDGNIHLVNSNGNVILANPLSDTIYNRDLIDTDVRQAGGVIDARFASGNVAISIPEGYLTAIPGPHFERPELIGDIIEVSTRDGFGNREGGNSRQLVVYAETQLTLLSGGGIRPIWAFKYRPKNGIVGGDDLFDPSIVSSSSEILIEVEGAEDIDPAIFTDVRNYSFSNIAIRLPRDQLYDSDIYEDEDDQEDDQEPMF